jgi:hypothetical protein
VKRVFLNLFFLILFGTLFSQGVSSDTIKKTPSDSTKRPKITLYNVIEHINLPSSSSHNFGRDIFHSYGTPYPVINSPSGGGIRGGGSIDRNLLCFILNDDTSKIIPVGENREGLNKYMKGDPAALKMLNSSFSNKSKKFFNAIMLYNKNAGYGDSVYFYSRPQTEFIKSLQMQSDSITMLKIKPIGEENKKNVTNNKNKEGQKLNFSNTISPEQ